VKKAVRTAEVLVPGAAVEVRLEVLV
jgi:hypothetical protein